MEVEAPISEVESLVIGLIQANPLLGWQDGGHGQETALQKGGQSQSSASGSPMNWPATARPRGHDI